MKTYEERRKINDDINMKLHDIRAEALWAADVPEDAPVREELDELRDNLADAIEALLCPEDQ